MEKLQAGPWAQVARFRVYKNSMQENHARIKVFNNNRQRFPVRVLIEVQDANGNPVPFPAVDVWKIQLIDYATGQLLPSDWPVSSSNGDYIWDESIIPDTPEADSPPDGLEQVADGAVGQLFEEEEKRSQPYLLTFYVSTSSTRRTPIAARVRLPTSNEVYATTKSAWVTDPDGHGDGNGNFNSSVVAVPTPFPSLDIANYGQLDSNGNLMATRVGNTNYFFLAQEHYLFVNLNGRELPLRSVSASKTERVGFSVYKTGNPTDTILWGISYYAQPYASLPENLPLPPLRWMQRPVYPNTRYDPFDLFTQAAGTIMVRSDKRVVIGLIIGLLSGQFVDMYWRKLPEVPRTTLHILDIYGNYHSLTLYFGARANELKISKA